MRRDAGRHLNASVAASLLRPAVLLLAREQEPQRRARPSPSHNMSMPTISAHDGRQTFFFVRRLAVREEKQQ